MIRSAHIARPVARTIIRLVLVALALITTLMVANGTANAATEYGPWTLYTTSDLCKLTVAPKDASAQVGAQQTFTATITKTGPVFVFTDAVEANVNQTISACALQHIDALNGVTVKFTVVSGPNAGKTEDVALTDGVANFTITSAVAGVDVVDASLVLPDLCFPDLHQQEPVAAVDVDIPAGCESVFAPKQPQVEGLPNCMQIQAGALSDECLTTTLKDSGQVTWSAPQTVVAEADPSLSISSFKRCVSHQFKIAPVYSGGTITSSTLFVDGKKKQTKSGPDAFTLSPRSYKSGKHNFEVVTVFSSGKAASKFGSFTKCAARVTVKRVSPKFTG